MLEEEDSLGLPVATQAQWTNGYPFRQIIGPSFTFGCHCIAILFELH